MSDDLDDLVRKIAVIVGEPDCVRVNPDRWLSAEPGRSIVEHLNEMALAIANYTGEHGITRLSLKTDVGLMLGIAPGTSVDVATAAGSVEVYCERSARRAGTFEVGP